MKIFGTAKKKYLMTIASTDIKIWESAFINFNLFKILSSSLRKLQLSSI